jgi:hypothetical protein
MRYLVGLLFVLALGLMACSETAGTGGSGGTAGMGGDGGTGGNGGSGGSGGEIGDQFPAIDTLELTLNRVYDNGDQRGDEKYTFEVADLTVTHRWVRSNDPPDLLPPATRDAMDALVAVVQSTSYRINEDCEMWAVDFVPFPPWLSVVHAQDRLVLSVSDNKCADNDHSFAGPVMSCSDFERVFAAIREIVPEVESETCADYW